MAARAGSFGGGGAERVVVRVAVVPVGGHQRDLLRGSPERAATSAMACCNAVAQLRPVRRELAVRQGQEAPVRIRQQVCERAAEFLEPDGGEVFRRRGG